MGESESWIRVCLEWKSWVFSTSRKRERRGIEDIQLIYYALFIMLFIMRYLLCYLLCAIYYAIYYALFIMLFIMRYLLCYLLCAIYYAIYYALFIMLFIMRYLLCCLLCAIYYAIYYALFIMLFIMRYLLCYLLCAIYYAIYYALFIMLFILRYSLCYLLCAIYYALFIMRYQNKSFDNVDNYDNNIIILSLSRNRWSYGKDNIIHNSRNNYTCLSQTSSTLRRRRDYGTRFPRLQWQLYDPYPLIDSHMVSMKSVLEDEDPNPLPGDPNLEWDDMNIRHFRIEDR